jgi:hypothetical protein
MKTQGKNTIYVKRSFKQNFILITYENKNYDKKTYPKLVLNRLEIMKGPNFIYTPLGA